MVPGGDRRLTATVLSVGRDVRAQSGTIGVVLLLAITVISTGAIVTFGSEALIDTRQASQLQRTEHAMTLFDSRAAMVALGDFDVQTVSLGQESGGAYHIREDTGWIRVQHLNYTESASDPKNETIYNRSLGSIEYVNEDTVIAYQGGGVWRKTDNGSRMVSVPEFHYRAATLTLPVVRVTGSGSTAGRTQAVVTSTRQAHHVFPNRTGATAGQEVGAPYDNDDEAYRNPVENGTVRVSVHSDYYQGWAQFFRTRTDGNVTVHHNNDTVWVNLEATRTLGSFEIPNEGNSISVRGMAEGHPIDDFTVELSMDESAERHFSFWAESGSEQFEIHLQVDKNPCSTAEAIDMSVYYYNGSEDTYQGWQNKSIDASTTSGFSLTCNGGTATIEADLAGPVNLSYKDIDGPTGGSSKWHFGSDINSHSGIRDPTTWDQHKSSVDWEPNDYNASENETAHNVTNHYLSLMGPNVDLTVSLGPGGSDKLNEDASSGNLEYETDSSRFLNFLHITDNEIRIELN